MEKKTLIRVCAWCGKVRIGEQWRKAKIQGKEMQVTHGMCPGCYESVKGQ